MTNNTSNDIHYFINLFIYKKNFEYWLTSVFYTHKNQYASNILKWIDFFTRPF